MTNTLANVAGILCDGAKASCAAKIASSVEAALMAIQLTFRGEIFLCRGRHCKKRCGCNGQRSRKDRQRRHAGNGSCHFKCYGRSLKVTGGPEKAPPEGLYGEL